MTTFVIQPSPHPARANCIKAIEALPAGMVVTIRERKRSDETNSRMHAMIGEIAEQEPRFNKMNWKRLLIDQFQAETNNDQFDKLRDYWRRESIKIMPSLDGQRVITLGEQTRVWPGYVARAFVEWLHAWGVENNLRFSQ